jgi:hypothetical protein
VSQPGGHTGESMEHPPLTNSNPLFAHTEVQTGMKNVLSWGHSDKQAMAIVWPLPEASAQSQDTLIVPPAGGKQKPLLSQLSLQQSVLPVQAPPSDTHAAAQVPLVEQLSLAHWWLCLHLAPAGLLGLAQAMPGMEASAPPTRVAPINLSALPRVTLPSASSLARSSKKPSSSLAIGCPFPE